MNEPSLTRAEYSVVVLVPKPLFLELVAAVAAERSIPLGQFYFEEESSVLLVPPIGSFGSEIEFATFIHELKAAQLRREFVANLGTTFVPKGGWTAAEFDNYFDIMIRDRCAIVHR